MTFRPIAACSILTAALLSILALVSLGATRGANRDISASEIDEMKGTIASLKKQVSELEKRLESVETRTNLFVLPQAWRALPGAPSGTVDPNTGVTPRLPELKRPKIWGKSEYNGWEYFVIPVNESARTFK